MTNIVFVHLLNDYSGSPRVLKEVISIFNKKGFNSMLYVGSQGKGILSTSETTKKTYWYRRTEYKILTFFTYVFSQILLFFKLIFDRQVSKEAVVYINTLLPFGAALYAIVTHRKVVYHIHETSISPSILKHFLLFICRKISCFNIYVSGSHQDSLPIIGPQQKRIYNSLPQELIEDSSSFKYRHKVNDKFTVLMIASLREYKGVMEFVKLSTSMMMYADVSFKLLASASQDEIDFFFRGQSIPSNLCIFSYTDNVEEFYREANLVLNLSLVHIVQETFGLTLLEAMAYGVPVIVPPVGGPVEIVRDGVEGFHVDSRDHAALLDKVLLLYKNEDLCRRLSKNAKKRSRDFSAEKFSVEISEVVKIVADS